MVDETVFGGYRPLAAAGGNLGGMAPPMVMPRLTLAGKPLSRFCVRDGALTRSIPERENRAGGERTTGGAVLGAQEVREDVRLP
jgi:hypothetical protein